MKNLALKISRRDIAILTIGLCVGVLAFVVIGVTNKTSPSNVQTQRSGKVNALCTQVDTSESSVLRVENPACEQPASTQTLEQTSSGTSSGNSSPTPKSTKSTQSTTNNPSSQSTSSTPQCNEALKTAYTAKRNADVAYENSVHDAFHPNTPYGSSYYADQVDNEASRHTAALAQIEANYQIKLASANCA